MGSSSTIHVSINWGMDLKVFHKLLSYTLEPHHMFHWSSTTHGTERLSWSWLFIDHFMISEIPGFKVIHLRLHGSVNWCVHLSQFWAQLQKINTKIYRSSGNINRLLIIHAYLVPIDYLSCTIRLFLVSQNSQRKEHFTNI